MGKHELLQMFVRLFPALTVSTLPPPKEPDILAPLALVEKMYQLLSPGAPITQVSR